ncbi:MAG: formimidoylglutamate deiminase, partial [Actinomycetes bacterium]
MTAYACEYVWLGDDQVTPAVTVQVDGARITEVAAGGAPPAGAVRLAGVTVPGLANAHSHAFHRALRSRTQSGRGTFWEWRDRMYQVASRLDPDGYHRLARATFAEMALGGVTCVGEFHYLHHRGDGGRYDDPNAMGEALLAAAAEAGIRITLLDTCYLEGGPGRPLEGPQIRFGDGDAGTWADRVARLRPGAGAAIGAGLHSVRAVPPDQAEVMAAWADDRGAPLHFHLSEQPGENDACRAAYDRTPTQVLADSGALGPRATAVHATHVDGRDGRLLSGSGTGVCMCPTTERDLADGIGPAGALSDAGVPISLGSDSHAVVDLWEEARSLEMDERLASGVRGHWTPADLLRVATAGGHRALG